MRGGKALVVQGLPQHMSDLATLYGIEGLLPST
jgi:ABC-type transporter Mla MlaB component